MNNMGRKLSDREIYQGAVEALDSHYIKIEDGLYASLEKSRYGNPVKDIPGLTKEGYRTRKRQIEETLRKLRTETQKEKTLLREKYRKK